MTPQPHAGPAAAGRRIPGRDADAWPGQSLAEGAAGVTLLHIELAAAGLGDWGTARGWLERASAGEVSVGGNAGLYFGAPALEFVMRAASSRLSGLAPPLARLEAATDRVVRDRLRAAALRRAQGLPALAEFDLIRGLTGLGVVLLARGASTPLLGDLLSYLVALTEPVTDQGDRLPGWWAASGPDSRPSAAFPGGHANNGMAHGIAGPLALLAVALRGGTVVSGHRDALARITAWLGQWPHGAAPYWVRRAELGARRPACLAARPSWCYGALGVLRAQQLAALSIGDHAGCARAADAARSVLTDPSTRNLTRDASLCHGWAGLAVTAAAIAADAPDPGAFITLVKALGGELSASASRLGKAGFLEGRAGAALVLRALDSPPATNWTRALLIA
jgi:lantibiotic biosynthesis protein